MINSINFLGNINKINFLGAKQPEIKTKPYGADCFIKSEKKESKNDFVSWANETDFVKKDFKKLVKGEAILGKGFTHTVFAIPNNDKYVIRTHNTALPRMGNDFSNYKIVDSKDENLKGNFGQTVAIIKSDDIFDPEFEVLMRQKGITNGNPPTATIYAENGDLLPNQLPYEDPSRKEHYAKTLQILANMPQESYDELVKTLDELGKIGYRFDYYNSNNFMLDDAEEKINIIDLEPMRNPYQNNFGDALFALSNSEYFTTYVSPDGNVPAEDKDKALLNTMSVFDKFFKALQNNNKQIKYISFDFLTKVLTTMPMYQYFQTMDKNEILAKMKGMGILANGA